MCARLFVGCLRLLRRLYGYGHRVRITPHAIAGKNWRNAHTTFATLPVDTVAAIRAAATRLAVPDDIAMLTLLGVTLAWRAPGVSSGGAPGAHEPWNLKATAPSEVNRPYGHLRLPIDSPLGPCFSALALLYSGSVASSVARLLFTGFRTAEQNRIFSVMLCLAFLSVCSDLSPPKLRNFARGVCLCVLRAVVVQFKKVLFGRQRLEIHWP